MRLLAVISKDPTMLDIFKKGLDPHKQTAQAIFQKSEISDGDRQIAKTLNYGTIYGGGANMVMSQLSDLTGEEAREFLYRFYRSYPGLRGWQRDVSEGAPVKVIDGEAYKVSRSALGRIRYIDPGQRNPLINTPIQSTRADLQKIALGRLYEELAKPENDAIMTGILVTKYKMGQINAEDLELMAEDLSKQERASAAKKVLAGIKGAGELKELISCRSPTKSCLKRSHS
jgi:DNA polymerase I-like protein with 3'-5' exonuclease and polymerase domains